MSMPRPFQHPRCYTLPYTQNPKTWAIIAQWNKYFQVLFWTGLEITLPPPLLSSLTFPVFCCWKTGNFSPWRSGRNVKPIKSRAYLVYIVLWFTFMPSNKFLADQLRYLQSLTLWRYSIAIAPNNGWQSEELMGVRTGGGELVRKQIMSLIQMNTQTP
jgi:hypothetical protein